MIGGTASYAPGLPLAVATNGTFDAASRIAETITWNVAASAQASAPVPEGAPIDPIETRLATCAAYAPSADDLATLPGDAFPFAFNLNANSADAAPVLTDETATELEAACAPFADNGWTAGCLLIDLGTGRGLAANLDARSYGASAFKALYALYLCETQLDTGRADVDTPCPEFGATEFMDPEGTYLHDGMTDYPLGTLVVDSVTKSDNDSYRILRANFDAAGFAEWLTAGNFPSSLADDWYPTYGAREAGLLWLHAAAYLESDAPSAAWFGELLEQTETSFMREALTSGVAGSDIVVRDKAGWYADDDPAYCGINDGGIVTVDGRDYLLCVMSNAPFSASNEAAFESIIATVFAAREDLA